MNNLTTAKVNQDYIEALQVTQEVESPAVGFISPAENKGGPIALSTANIKQNNTLIYLLLKQAEEVRSLKDQLEKIGHDISTFVEKERRSKDLEESIADLSKRLGVIAVAEKSVPRIKQGPIYYNKDPKAIFTSQFGKEKK